MGAMRTARRAGLMADTTVTPTPTTSAATTVRAWNTRPLDGRVIPNPLSSACSPTAARTPSPRPISEATSPTMAASASTDRNTWRRLAPSTRSRASSRVRWPTMIEKVLKMVKPPTNSAMKAKISSAVEKNPRAWLMVARRLVGHRLPGHHLDARGQHPGDGPLDLGLVRPGGGQHVDRVVLTDPVEQLLGGGQPEGGDGGTGQVVGRAELGDARHGERLRRPEEEDPDLLPHVEVVLGTRCRRRPRPGGRWWAPSPGGASGPTAWDSDRTTSRWSGHRRW